MIRYTCSIVLLLFISIVSMAQDSSFTARIDRDSILIGEKIKLELKARISADDSIQWVVVDSLQHFEVLERGKIDTQRNATEFLLTQIITLTSWDSGSWRLPSFLFDRKRSKPIQVMVTHSPMDYNQDYHDVKDILGPDKPLKSTWKWYLILLALLLLIFLLIFPKKKKKETTAFIPDPGVYKTSLARLQKLEQSGSMDAKIFYTELVDIFRTYLNKRRGILSHSKTTDDLAIQLQTLNLPVSHNQHIVQTLRLADSVKYAKYQPSVQDNKLSINTIRESIQAIEQMRS